MRASVLTPFLRRWPLGRLAALSLVLLAILAVSWSGTTPAGAQDDYQPDSQVVADVWTYAKETANGPDHVLRWFRVLSTFDAIDGMTASEAQGYADRGWNRWVPVVAALNSGEPDSQLIADIRGYSRETRNGYDHVHRWMRVLHTFDALDDMTAAEAQGYADTYTAARWDPVVAELAAMEASASEPEPTPAPTPEPTPVPNRAPVVNTQADYYSWFTGNNNAPRGTLVSKPFYGIFSDPDGDNLTYAVAITGGDSRLVDVLQFHNDGGSDAQAAQSGYPLENVLRVFFQADAEDDWDAIQPPLPNPLPITVTLTATDSDGLSVSLDGNFLIGWEPACEQSPPEDVSALGVPRALVAFWDAPSAENACEPSGYSVEARSASGGDWKSETVGPLATRHVLNDLTPGMYEYRVQTIYPSRKSTPRAPQEGPTGQGNVPTVCDIDLTVAADIAGGVSGSWTNRGGPGTGCVSGGAWLQWKEAGHDYWASSYKLPNAIGWTQPFAFGGLDAGTAYEFRVVASDARCIGVAADCTHTHDSDAVSATVLADPTRPADANSPRNLRVGADNNSGISLNWALPASTPAGSMLTAYVVEWQTGTAAAETVVLAAPGSPESTDPFVARIHRITGLTDGNAYTVRIAARFTDSVTNATQDAWSTPAAPVTVWSEPTQVWLAPPSPTHNTDIGRTFFFSDSNKAWGVTTCEENGGDTINCPGRTTVSLDSTGSLTAQATHTVGGVSTTSSLYEGEVGGPGSFLVYASGGLSKLVVVWEGYEESDPDNLDAYVVQHRKGTSGAWTDTVVTDTTKRTHTITGLTPGSSMPNTWQVRVRGRVTDGMDPVVTRTLGFTSEILTVQTFILWNKPPDYPTGIEVTPGSESLVVEWEPPEQSNRSFAHAYQVRHRERGGDGSWTVSDVLFPRPTLRMCRVPFCENPRSHMITGLTAGTEYDVEVRAHNANGPGPWATTWSAHVPNDPDP